jgi:hypothetical protein
MHERTILLTAQPGRSLSAARQVCRKRWSFARRIGVAFYAYTGRAGAATAMRAKWAV